MNKTLKKNIGKLHLWLGLGSGLVVFIVALTGSLLVFEDEIDAYVNPEFYTVATVAAPKKTIDYCVDILQKQHAVEKINRIYTFNAPDRTLRILGKNTKGKSILFSIDPYTGKVLAAVPQKSRFFSVVLDLHRHLIMGDFGKFITGCSALIFVFLLISGMVLWWPKKIKHLKQRLTVKWNASFKRVNWDFHSTFGFYSFLVLLIICLTGLTWSFKWFESGIYLLADGTTKKPSTKVENPTKEDPKLNQTAFYDRILKATDSIFPYKGNTQIRMPNDSINSIFVIKENLEKAIPNQASAAYFDRYTAKNIESRPHESFSTGDKVRRLIYPIHTGSIYGYPTKILAFLVCLFAATLPISGFLIWLGRKK
ncbi:peptidase [Flavobacterium sp. IR1]|nr:peptidase [Flavobacterium sp. IR1]